MKTDRRSFLKSAGLLTAAAAVLNPATLFAQAEKGRKKIGQQEIGAYLASI